jgi:hypothetical protein
MPKVNILYKEITMVDSNNPYDLLKEEMTNDDTQIKVNAIHRLSIVMAWMSPEKLVTELVPYLNSNFLVLYLFI